MEKKIVKVPFEVEMAQKITNGEIDGRIVTRDGRNARVVCWDKKSDSIYNVVALIDEKIMERILTYTIKGYEVDEKDSDNDLMLEIPEYMTFKDGDILMLRNQYHFVFVYNSEIGKYGSYFGITLDDYDSFFDSEITSEHDENIIEFRKASTEEKQKLIDILKERKEPKAKEYLKRFFNIEVKPECEFKPFDKVLVRNSLEMEWIPRFFERETQCSQSVRYITLDNNSWKYCIPYNEKTAHLLGTIEDYKGD